MSDWWAMLPWSAAAGIVMAALAIALLAFVIWDEIRRGR